VVQSINSLNQLQICTAPYITTKSRGTNQQYSMFFQKHKMTGMLHKALTKESKMILKNDRELTNMYLSCSAHH